MKNSFLSRRAILWAGPVVILAAAASMAIRAQGPDSVLIARGGGTTIVEGGTGPAGGFIPVITKVGFHAEKRERSVSGAFECLALVPGVSVGAGSGEFTANAMYVTGRIENAVVTGRTAILSGRATITGLGAGASVPFTFTVSDGGSGAAATLVTEGSPRLVFNETLLDGGFEVGVKKGDK